MKINMFTKNFILSNERKYSWSLSWSGSIIDTRGAHGFTFFSNGNYEVSSLSWSLNIEDSR